MTEELGMRVQDMFKTVYDAVDLKYLRPLKRQMFNCLIECQGDKYNFRQSEECSKGCGKSFRMAMTIVDNELKSFQGRIDRCLMDCQDPIRKERDEEKARRYFDSCATKCVDKFISTAPDVVKSLCKELDDMKKD